MTEDEARSNFGVYADLEGNLTRAFLANVAARFESYSDFGEKVTGKLALRFQPAEQFVLRGAVSSGFRAPALSQIFYQSTVTNFMLGEGGQPVPFQAGIFPVEHPAAIALGAENLDEETSVNYSGGFAFTPVAPLTFTADLFFITIDDRIILTSEVSGDEIVEILEPSAKAELRAAEQGPTVYLMVGVNGVGKTTTVAKLADHLVREGRSVLVAAADTFRAGAVAQLETWAKRIGAAAVTSTSTGEIEPAITSSRRPGKIPSARTRAPSGASVSTSTGRMSVRW